MTGDFYTTVCHSDTERSECGRILGTLLTHKILQLKPQNDKHSVYPFQNGGNIYKISSKQIKNNTKSLIALEATMLEIPNGFYRTSVKALIFNEKREILLIREEKGRDLPGGGLDFGESPQEGIKRELQEEIGINVVSVNKNPSYFITCQKANGIRIANVIYETKINIEDLKNFTPSDECLEIKFFNLEETKKEKLFPNVEKFIKQIQI